MIRKIIIVLFLININVLMAHSHGGGGFHNTYNGNHADNKIQSHNEYRKNNSKNNLYLKRLFIFLGIISGNHQNCDNYDNNCKKKNNLNTINGNNQNCNQMQLSCFIVKFQKVLIFLILIIVMKIATKQ